jgi:preprotein translocase subunit SecA
LRELYKGLLTTAEDFIFDEKELKKVKPDDIANLLYDRAIEIYKGKEELFGAEKFREIERAILLQNVDYNWMEHIDAMDDLKDTIRLQAYAQRDPINEYRLQGADMFDAMIADIRDRTVRMVLSVIPNVSEVERVQVAKPISEGFEGDGEKKPKKITIAKKAEASIGRNDLCPCGSGKKYKKCCGAPSNQ